MVFPVAVSTSKATQCITKRCGGRGGASGGFQFFKLWQRIAVPVVARNPIPNTGLRRCIHSYYPPPTKTLVVASFQKAAVAPSLDVNRRKRFSSNTKDPDAGSGSSTSRVGDVDNPSTESSEPKNSTKTTEMNIDDVLATMEEIVEVDSAHLDAILDRSRFTVEVAVKMPDMDNNSSSKVAQWYYKPGDIIQRGNVLCDIETPGFTFGMETDDEEVAILGQILVEAGHPVPDHTVICILYHEAKVDDKKTKDNDDDDKEHVQGDSKDKR